MSLIKKKVFLWFFKRNNGVAMAVLAAPLPVALILLHSRLQTSIVYPAPMRKSPTECRVGGRTGRECLECYATGRINVKITEGKVYRTVVRPALMYGQRHGHCRRHRKENAKMDVRSYEAGQDHK